MRRLIAIAAAAVVPAATMAPATADTNPADHVQVLVINDLHGNLDPPVGSSTGGAAYLAAHLRRLRTGHQETVTVGAGDLVGGSPLVSALFDDVPTLEALDAMDLRYSAIGNHEFDRGRAGLRTLRRHSRIRWLGANVERAQLAPSVIHHAGGIEVGLVGATLEGTPSVTAPHGTDGYAFTDEAQAVNRAARQLRADGADVVIALLHQGGRQTGSEDPNGCDGLTGPVIGIAKRLSDAVDAVASAHTHRAYVCTIDGKLVTSASSYGRLVTDYEVTLDRRTGSLRELTARNVAVTRDVAPDPEVQTIIDRAHERARPVAERVVGTVPADLERGDGDELSALGGVIADAEREATGADVALANPGGIRADVEAGEVTYEDLFAVLPFQYRLQTLTLTGAQLARVLDEQYRPGEDILLQRSQGLAYRLDGGHVLDLTLGGAPVAADQRLRVTVNAFLAAGGDGFRALRGSGDTGPMDVDALAGSFGSAR